MAKHFSQPGEATIGGLANDDTPRHAKLDTTTHTLQTIDYAHHEVHAGSHFYLTYPFTLTGTTDTQEFFLVTPNLDAWPHMLWNMTGSAITEIYVYEDTELTPTTDAITVLNNNRNSTDSAGLAVFLGAASGGDSSTDTGTLVWHHKSGASSNQSRASMTARNDGEIILKQDTVYRVRFITGTAANLCNLRLEWYEHTNKS